MNRSLIIIVFSFVSSLAFGEPREVQLPRFVGDTLVIEGPIRSHIYDFLSYAGTALDSVETVELNSLGGEVDWALVIAERIRKEGWNTRLAIGQVCASACTLLFSAGTVREANSSTWFGIHGARLGGNDRDEFLEICYEAAGDSKKTFNENKAGCQNYVSKWYELSFAATKEMFGFMEAGGTSSLLMDDYFALDDDLLWFEQANFLRKPDWVLPAKRALDYNFVTELLD